MMCMKKMMTVKRLCGHIAGAVAGALLGLAIACKLEKRHDPAGKVKSIAKQAFKAIEEAVGL